MIAKMFCFFNSHRGYSLNFTVVYHCQHHGGIPPPSRGIVGKIRVPGVKPTVRSKREVSPRVRRGPITCFNFFYLLSLLSLFTFSWNLTWKFDSHKLLERGHTLRRRSSPKIVQILIQILFSVVECLYKTQQNWIEINPL